MAGVWGWYVPPANLYPHLRHSQIPVPLRATETMSHFGQRWSAREILSMSHTLLRTNRPYRQPKRPALPVTFPFALCVDFAMMETHRSVFFYLSSELIYLIEDLDHAFAFRELVDQVVELDLDPCRDADHADPRAVLEPLVLLHHGSSGNIAIGACGKVRRDLDCEPELLEPDREERAQGLDSLLHLLVKVLEGVDIHPGLFHRHLDPVCRVGVPGLGVDRVP